MRAAAKNFRGVLVVVDPADYPRLLRRSTTARRSAFRFELMRKAFAHTAAYDTAIAATLTTIIVERRRVRARPRLAAPLPRDARRSSLEKIRDLRYGENPHQRAAWYVARSSASAPATAASARPTILQGKELSYTNLLDLDAALRIVLEFDEPAAAVIKHTNPCGVGVGDSRG